MLKTFGRVTDGLLALLVPKATAAAANCHYGTSCDGPFCGGSLVRIRRYWVCCPRSDSGMLCETYRKTCSCYVGG